MHGNERLKAEVAIPRQRIMQDLGLSDGDPALARFLAVAGRLEGRTLPSTSLREMHHAEFVPELFPSTKRKIDARPMEYGIDYFFGKNHGDPRKVEDARRAEYQGRIGIEPWRTIKTVAYQVFHEEDGQEIVEEVIFASVRSDRAVAEKKLAEYLGVNEEELKIMPEIEGAGLNSGTLSPLSEIDTSIDKRFKNAFSRHIFDLDLIGGEDFPADDLIFTSSGDPEFYLALKARRYIESLKGINFQPPLISEPMPDQKRMFVSTDYSVIGGDPGSAEIYDVVEDSINKHFGLKDYGNRARKRREVVGNPDLAGSIDPARYYESLREAIAQELRKYKDREGDPVLVGTASVASERIASEEAGKVAGVELVRRQEAIEKALQSLNVGGNRTLLMGLPSIYDPEQSPFTPEFLEDKEGSDDFARKIDTIVNNNDSDSGPGTGIRRKIDTFDVYEVIQEEIAKMAPEGRIENMHGETVFVVMAVSDIDEALSHHHPYLKGLTNPRGVRNELTIIRPESPEVMVSAMTTTPVPSNKVRVVLVSPNQALGRLIAEKLIKVTNKVAA